MEPQLLIASLYEYERAHIHAQPQSGQHDIIRAQGAKFDTIGVIIALLSMVGIMIAVAMMGEGYAPAPSPSASHTVMSR